MAEPVRIDALLDEARTRIDRVDAADLEAEVAAGALVVDIRPQAFRETEGELPFGQPIEAIHLPWRLDPTSPDRIPAAGADTRVIVVCNEGYASSLAAATLADLGVTRAADLAGGARAWFAWRDGRDGDGDGG